MNLSAAALRLMAEKGLTLQDVAEIVAANERGSDRTNAERQARYRERRSLSQELWDARRGQVFERDGFECAYCGSQEDLVCDHVVPLAQGGTNDLDNLVTACRGCNASKAGQTPEEWLA